MASIYTFRNKLYMNIRINGKQVRKSTGLEDTKQNKLKVQKEILPNFLNSIEEKKLEDYALIYYIDKFLEEKEHILKERTYYRYKKIIDTWILPKYHNYKVSSLKHSVIKDYINEQYNLKKSAKTVELYITVFSGILQEAVFDGTLTSNPFKSIKKKKKVKPKITPFSVNEVNLLLENSTGWIHNYIGIATHFGLRSGEIIGLKWSDINGKSIKINRTRDFGKNSTPKTLSSRREIPLFNSAKRFIDNQRKLTGHLEYVFVTSKDLPWSNTQWIGKYHWYPLLKRLNLRKRRMYEMRHTFATNMLNSGFFKVTEIAHLMGHTTTEYLFNVYSKYIESEKNLIPLDKNIYSSNKQQISNKLREHQ